MINRQAERLAEHAAAGEEVETLEDDDDREALYDHAREEDGVDGDIIEQSDEEQEMELSELTKRVAAHMEIQRERMVKKAKAKTLIYEDQETATLLIPKKYRFGTESSRIPVRILESTLTVSHF